MGQATSSISLHNNTPNAWYCHMGWESSIPDTFPTPDYSEGVFTAIDDLVITGDFAAKMAERVDSHLKHKGYVYLKPGASRKWDGFLLSFVRQGTCMRVDFLDARTVRSKMLIKRPIYSGPTVGYNNIYKLGAWLVDNSYVRTSNHKLYEPVYGHWSFPQGEWLG